MATSTRLKTLLVRDTVLKPLELIVRGAPHVLMRVLYLTHHPFRSVPLTHSQREPIPQPFNCALPFEGGEPSVEHQPDSVDELIGVRSQSDECFDGQMLEHRVTLRVSATHENHHFVGKFEGAWFEFHSSGPYVE